jgi:hypothetical protein
MQRLCHVRFQDLDGLRQTIAVEADRVYEACVAALRVLKKARFVEKLPGPASTLHVQVLEPTITHQISVVSSNDGWNAARIIPKRKPTRSVSGNYSRSRRQCRVRQRANSSRYRHVDQRPADASVARGSADFCSVERSLLTKARFYRHSTAQLKYAVQRVHCSACR